jgi:hypothetical protein
MQRSFTWLQLQFSFYRIYIPLAFKVLGFITKNSLLKLRIVFLKARVCFYEHREVFFEFRDAVNVWWWNLWYNDL